MNNKNNCKVNNFTIITLKLLTKRILFSYDDIKEIDNIADNIFGNIASQHFVKNEKKSTTLRTTLVTNDPIMSLFHLHLIQTYMIDAMTVCTRVTFQY